MIPISIEISKITKISFVLGNSVPILGLICELILTKQVSLSYSYSGGASVSCVSLAQCDCHGCWSNSLKYPVWDRKMAFGARMNVQSGARMPVNRRKDIGWPIILMSVRIGANATQGSWMNGGARMVFRARIVALWIRRMAQGSKCRQFFRQRKDENWMGAR